ncbi:MAG TPA: WbqC family protein [Lachnospiraceae bacterium]|nr:WbqC family protein [Lachnospiraceae bacterium]
MQPYFLPYIGYWQLMAAVDKYVIYDDVNFINRGWINRNRILLEGESHFINIPMIGASQNKLINEIGVNNEEKLIEKNLRMVEYAYKKAPYFTKVYPLVKKILECKKEILSQYIAESFYIIAEYLSIETEFILSSQLDKDRSLKGQDKVLAICRILGATEYYNAIGGQGLYSDEDFEKSNLKLCFLKTDDITYPQLGGTYQSNLSILDVMMFNSQEKVKEMLHSYTLITQ